MRPMWVSTVDCQARAGELQGYSAHRRRHPHRSRSLEMDQRQLERPMVVLAVYVESRQAHFEATRLVLGI